MAMIACRKLLPVGSASNEVEAHRSLFHRPFLFPRSFTLELADGRKVHITRTGFPQPEQYQVAVQEKEGTTYIRIPSFSNPKFEQIALQAVEKAKGAKAIIIDVRGNSGGTSPETLVGTVCSGTRHMAGACHL
jgi:carboxyl-terminal processing protease